MSSPEVKNVVKATEAAVCPIVAAEDPEGLQRKLLLAALEDRGLQANYVRRLRSFLGESCIVDGPNSCLSSILEVPRMLRPHDKLLSKAFQETLLLCLVTKHQTHWKRRTKTNQDLAVLSCHGRL